MSDSKPTNTPAPAPTNIIGNVGPTNLDCSKASTNVWLVKVPKYLAKKWNEAQDNTNVGVIRITQSKVGQKQVQEVLFHLNEALGRTVSIKIGNKTLEEAVPLEHKFVMTQYSSQAVYILKQSDDGTKENLQISGKVTQRAECTPVQNDTNYIKLKRETVKSFTEPKRQIKMASDFIPRTTFLPRSTHAERMDKKDKVKKLRKEKEKVLDVLFNAFNKHQFYNIKDLVKLTQQPVSYLKDILHEICKYNAKGDHKNTWELKEEFKQAGSGAADEKKKAAAVASLAKDTEKDDDFMDDDDDDDDDFDDDDDDDDDDMIETM
ncbi:unnamed protein product [Brachionus calyciflorus]|uniref:General transcription factor IIF subunit 2 n=1 Tax=Brachionus calyciflorus TaxID=104777 RepID=A0A813YJY3_9BILA|nr:unnamed protein product [Brachionus calyciflorus]